MNKTLKEIDDWYEENLSEFDVGQLTMIDYLMDIAKKNIRTIPAKLLHSTKRKWDYVKLIQNVGLRPNPQLSNSSDSYGTTYKLIDAGPTWHRLIKTKNNEDGNWVYIKADGNYGWILSQFCTIVTKEE